MADLLEGLPVTLSDKVGCLRREIRMREKVYAGRVGRGLMKQAEADYEIRVMKAILYDYTSGNVPKG
jgi:hypothetical protein